MNMRPAFTSIAMAACATFFSPACADGGNGPPPLPPLLMKTRAFPDGGIIPSRYAGFHGVQPGFEFLHAPPETKSFAIVFHDIDVAVNSDGGDVLHWIAWNIPAAARGIPEGKLPAGSVTGRNILGRNSYGGPGAPPGPRYHHYVFELYALTSTIDLTQTAGRDELLAAIKGKVVAKAAYVGRFRRAPGQSLGTP